MGAPSNDDARFRAVGSPDVVTIAGNRLDIPDDRRHVHLLGRLVGICSPSDVRDAMVPVLVRGVLRDANDPTIRHRFLLFPPPQILAERRCICLIQQRVQPHVAPDPLRKIRPVLLPQGAHKRVAALAADAPILVTTPSVQTFLALIAHFYSSLNRPKSPLQRANPAATT